VTAFLLIGAVGVALLLVALVVGDLLEGVVEGLGGGGLFSTEALAGFLGALGFGGAITLGLTESSTLAWVVGVALGIGLGALAGWASKKLHEGDHTGATSTHDLVEQIGQVVSDIPAEGYGVVSLSKAGHLTRVNARSSTPVPAGTTVTVVSILSPTAVQVEPLFLP
jgi:membrane protein implicated in regulation of membrane protease activity